MPTIIAVTGVPAIEKTLDALDPRDRQNLERRAVRAGGKIFAEALKSVAAASHVPRSFSAASPARMTRVSTSGSIVHAIVRPPSPLFNILQPGARAHEIAPRTSGLFLRGRGKKRHAEAISHPGALAGPAGSGSWDPKGRKRKGAFFSTKPVRHPGLRSRNLIGPAFESSAQAASDAIAAVILGQSAGAPMGAPE